MLQDIRQNIQGTAAKIVVGLIVISFAFFGIESILVSGGASEIAEVNGEYISPNEVQQMVNTEKRRLISIMGENIDPAMLDDQRLGAQALQSVISRKLQMQAASSLDITAAENDIGSLIAGMEQFQVEGQFSPDLYRSLLANAGFSPTSFKLGLKEDMILNQLRSGLAASDFATTAELDLNAKISGELRDLRYVTIPLQVFSAEIEITDAEVNTYYEEKSGEFLSQESLELDYIELDPDDFREPVAEKTLLEQYELEKEDYAYATENRVSHILFIKNDGESDDELNSRAAAVVSNLATGKRFSDVAQASSDDIGSASLGGDLGFSSGDTFPPEMEAAIAELAVGQVSELVQTDAGLHIIKLTERRDGKMPPLDEMRAQLTDRIQLEAARVELLRTNESLSDLAFNAEDLSEPAKKLGLTVKQSGRVTRNQKEGLFANASLLAAAFSEDVLEAGHNSEVIELGGNQFVVLRVRKHNPTVVKPLEQVRDEIVARMSRDAAVAAVLVEAERTLAALRSGAAVEAFANDNGYDWQVELAANRTNTLVPRAVLQRAFELSAPAKGESVFEFVLTASGDALVFELVRVTPGDYTAMSAQKKQILEQQISGEFAGLVNVEFQNGLRERADITISM